MRGPRIPGHSHHWREIVERAVRSFERAEDVCFGRNELRSIARVFIHPTAQHTAVVTSPRVNESDRVHR